MTEHLKHKFHWWRLRLEWYRKKLILSNPPYFINLEPTGFCNLHCSICSYKQDRGKGYLKVELARKVIADAAQFGVSQIRFFLAGEPLFHPHLGELIEYTHSVGVLTQIHTNATILDEKRSISILESGLDSLSLSFDGETEEEYELIRIGSDYNKTLNNILNFLQLKKERGLENPQVTLQVIKPYKPGLSLTPELSFAFKSRFAKLPVDYFRVLYPFAWPGQETQAFVRPKANKIFPCPILWQSLSVGWDGRILGCCGDLNGLITLGNVKENQLQDVWNGKALVAMRRAHVENNFNSIKLCHNCDIVYVRVHPAIRDLKDLITGRWQPI